MKGRNQKHLQLHLLSVHLHGHQICTRSHSLFWAQSSAGAKSMTCWCATARWGATVKRLRGWLATWRPRHAASGASCNTGTSVQEGPRPQSCARLCRRATSGLCSSPPASCRMTGATTWCTRLWQRGQCPVGLSLFFWTCLTLSILRSWGFSAALTSAGTLTGDTDASVTRCFCVSTKHSHVYQAEWKIHTLTFHMAIYFKKIYMTNTL